MTSPASPIGVFDSGIGGLSVLQALRHELPHERFVYLADSGNAPYGDARGDAFVQQRTRTIARHLREQHQILVHGPSAPFTHPDFQASMARYALGFGVRLAPMDIAATFGNSEAVNLALDALTQPGDMVAIESPTFYGILQAIEVRGLRALEIPCSPHTGISIEALELAARNEPRLRAVVVVPPPSGW